MSLSFTEEQIERYSRHIILPEVGGKGQQKLLNARVFLVGAGALALLPHFILPPPALEKSELPMVIVLIIQTCNARYYILQKTSGAPRLFRRKRPLRH